MLKLRPVQPTDLSIFHSYHLDPVAVHMLAFLPKERADRAVFDAHWEKILAMESVVIRTIVKDNRVAGHVLRFMNAGKPEIGYWIGREFWGNGIATAALLQFITTEETQRPLHAHVAQDNIGSLRVLQKCGFEIQHTERSYAAGRDAEIEEYALRLSA